MVWGGTEADTRTGEQLQTQIIAGKDVWLHRDHNKLTACRLISNKLRTPIDSALWWVVQLFHYISHTITLYITYKYCKNNRNKMHGKCKVLESSWNHSSFIPGPWKSCLPWNWCLVPKRIEITVLSKISCEEKYINFCKDSIYIRDFLLWCRIIKLSVLIKIT